VKLFVAVCGQRPGWHGASAVTATSAGWLSWPFPLPAEPNDETYFGSVTGTVQFWIRLFSVSAIQILPFASASSPIG
jgi:hypothetical protein